MNSTRFYGQNSPLQQCDSPDRSLPKNLDLLMVNSVGIRPL